MKNCKSNITLFAGYKLVLQLSKVVEDPTTGLITSAEGWTNFNNPMTSFKEYSNGRWTVDYYSTNPDAVIAISNMIDIQTKFDRGAISLEDAQRDFKVEFNKWETAHKKQIPGFICKEIIGLNKSASVAGTANSIMKFFSDVPDFKPALRFVNTLALNVKNGGREAAIEYVKGYFALQGKQDEADDITAKMGSTGVAVPEWDDVEVGINNCPVASQVNHRLKIYYGAPGAGKTTFAMSELTNPENVIVCNACMDANDMLFDFTFDEQGKPQFIPGCLYKAIENGEPVLLDEINLLNDDVLRFLQGITDNKQVFTAKGRTIHVKDGFMIIGTMNLTVNGHCYPLPEPLIDRAVELREFTMDSTMLEQALA